MILDIYEQVTGSVRPSLLAQTEFESLDGLFGRYDQREQPTLLIVEPEDLVEVLTWIDDDDDVCLTTDPESLIDYRLRCLGGPSSTALDPMTGLLSRPAFEQALAASITDDSITSRSLTLCDIDRFKQLNDQHGHHGGDEVLVEVAEILGELCGESDLLARFGGESFVILSDRDTASVVELAEQVRLAIEKRFAGELDVTTSVGIATQGTGRPETATADVLFKQADEALYAAKAAGRNRVVHYAEMRANCDELGQHADVAGLENRARVLSERVSNFIAMRSRNLINQFRSESETDSLTRFYNRGYLDRRLASEVKKSDVPMCIAFADLDHFGSVNKSQGWPSGDKVLREVGDLIRAELRDTDWVGRYGGEEFCIVMQNTKIVDARPVLERLCKSVEAHDFVSTSGEPIRITLSIGAVESTASEDHEQLLERASQKALTAKNDGRNRVMT